MRENNFTATFRQALIDAQREALQKENGFIEAIHLLDILCRNSTILNLLKSAHIYTDQLQEDTQKTIAALPRVSGTNGDIGISRELMNILNLMGKYAQERKDQFIASELFFLPP